MSSKTLAGRIAAEARADAMRQLVMLNQDQYENLYRTRRRVLEELYGYEDQRSTTGAHAAAQHAAARPRDPSTGSFT